MPQAHCMFFDSPGSRRLQGAVAQMLEASPVLQAHRIRILQPTIPCSRQTLITNLLECAMLSAPHLVNGITEVLHHVELVKANAVIRIVDISACDVDIGWPHIHRDAFDRRAFLLRQTFEEVFKARCYTLISHVENSPRALIGDDGDVLMPTLERCLIDRQIRQRLPLPTREPTLDGA